MSASEHSAWLARVLLDPSIALQIIEISGTPVGCVRLNIDRLHAEVHITIAPEARGRGLGTTVIRQATDTAVRRYGISKLIAHVNRHNEASLRAFGNAGFRPAPVQDDVFVRLERHASDRLDSSAPRRLAPTGPERDLTDRTHSGRRK